MFTGLPADQIARSQRVQNKCSQVYQQTRSLGHNGYRITQHSLRLKKKTRSRNTSSKFRCQYKIVTLACRHFEGVSFFISLLLRTVSISPVFEQKATPNSKVKPNFFPGTSVSWHHLFGTHCQPLSNMSQYCLSSNPALNPLCLPNLSSRI